MEKIRTVVTENSVWKFDMLLWRYVRFSRAEGPAPANRIPYTMKWESFTAVERHGDRLLVHRPVPWGEGALRMTGPIEWDDLNAAELFRRQRRQ